ncbi:MAG: glycine--tRNA ligase [Candidatus Aenigmatarchaeota archaeon]
MKDLLEIAKRRGFFWPAFEIYQGCSGFYEYGPVGALLKMRIEDFLRKVFVIDEGCLLFEGPILTTQDPWVASRHMEFFTDFTIECQTCGEAYRADHLLEEERGIKTDGMSLGQIQKEIENAKISCPKCGGKLGSVYDYNLMFKTEIGPGKRKISGALRPETAQVTYMSFKRLYEIGRKNLPFGVLQIGKSFRNEISPRKAVVRLREFSQAEAQFFLAPDMKAKHPKFSDVENEKISCLKKDWKKEKMIRVSELKQYTSEWIAYWVGRCVQIFEKMGIDRNRLCARQHKDTERAFYSLDTWDIEFLSDIFGRIELVGISDRTDYDLSRHAQLSGADLTIDYNGKKIIPHVIEVAFGIDRPLFSLMESCLKADKKRIYFSFPPLISPYQMAVFPLVSKDGLPEKAKEVYNMLKSKGWFVVYDEGFIGRLYYRQDEIGTPFCITIDHQTLEDDTVTIRNRNDQSQKRVEIKKLDDVLRSLFFK